MNWLAAILFALAAYCILVDLNHNGDVDDEDPKYPTGFLFVVGVILTLLGAWCVNTYYKEKWIEPINPGVTSVMAERLCIKEDVQVFVVDNDGVQHELKRCKQ